MILDDVSARRPERLARVEGVDVSYAQYRDLRMAGPFEDLAYQGRIGDRIWDAGGHNEIVWILTTSVNFFDVLDVRAGRGRLYSQADEGREFAVFLVRVAGSAGNWMEPLRKAAGETDRTAALDIRRLPKQPRERYFLCARQPHLWSRLARLAWSSL